MNKSGNIVLDVFSIMIIMFVLISNLVFGYYMWDKINTKIQTLDIDDPDSMQAINDMGRWFLFLDKMVPFIFVTLWLSAIFSSLLVNPEHPMFFIASLIMIFLFTIICIIFVDFGQRLFGNSLLTSITSQLSNSMFFANNLHLISFFVMMISSVWFYSKGRESIPGGFQP